MAIRNGILGGIDWGNEAPTFQDINETNDEMINLSISGSIDNAVSNYQIIKYGTDFDNNSEQIVDKFTVAAGVKLTYFANSGATYNAVDDTYDLIASSWIEFKNSNLDLLTTDNYLVVKGIFSSGNTNTIQLYLDDILVKTVNENEMIYLGDLGAGVTRIRLNTDVAKLEGISVLKW